MPSDILIFKVRSLSNLCIGAESATNVNHQPIVSPLGMDIEIKFMTE